jgi:hypothetical protein
MPGRLYQAGLKMANEASGTAIAQRGKLYRSVR